MATIDNRTEDEIEEIGIVSGEEDKKEEKWYNISRG